jgi:hypothetical protein
VSAIILYNGPQNTQEQACAYLSQQPYLKRVQNVFLNLIKHTFSKLCVWEGSEFDSHHCKQTTHMYIHMYTHICI